jgi:hypothetical protein
MEFHSSLLSRGRLLRVLPYVVAIVIGSGMLLATKGLSHYRPPTFGGFEPALTQQAALEIVHTGRTEMTYHPTGYSYLVALVYLCLPDVWRLPIAVLILHILSLPLVAWCVGQIAAQFSGRRLETWGKWLAALYYPLGYYAATFNNNFATLVFTSLAIVGLLPLLGPNRSLRRSVLVGLALGAAACLRPNFGPLGVVFVLALWRATHSLREAIVRSAPIAVVSIGMLGLMTAANPPEPGQLFRGSQGMSRSLLEGTYQYSYAWWDWEWDHQPDDLRVTDFDDPAVRDFYEHLQKIEAETGKPAADPATQAVIRRAAWARIFGLPANTLKKVLISTVRIWILIPTHLSSMTVKILIAAQEFLLLGLALFGLGLMRRDPGWRLLAIGVLAVPTISHWLLHVEARYSLPARGVELALVVVAIEHIARWLFKADSSTRV